MGEGDPQSSVRSFDETYREIRRFYNDGEFFRAYDLATDALRSFPGDVRLAHRAVLSLANSGATELALGKFSELGLEDSADLDVRSLLGRLKKDRAFAESGSRRRQLLVEAQAIYEDAYRAAQVAGNPESYYPGINAATLALLAGDPAKAATLAREVRAGLGERADPAEHADAPDRYWVLATAIEADLLIGDSAAAEPLIAPALKASGFNYAELATTGRQLERILTAKSMGFGLLGPFAPPAIVHYTGHIIAAHGSDGRFAAAEEAAVAAEIARILDGLRVGAAYGALAAGADILFAETLLARGAALNVVLPFKTDEFIEQSVHAAGGDWTARFQACLAAAKTVRFATEDGYLGDDGLFTYGSRLAMGLAVLCARHMHAPLRQLVVWDGEARSGVAGTAVDMVAWRDAGYPQTIVRCGSRPDSADLSNFRPPEIPPGRRDTRAMLFADVHGFSTLTDEQLPIFTREIIGAISDAISRFREAIAFINTWGDGVFAVFEDVAAAANCALAVQERLSRVDLAAVGLPPYLALRLGGHLGPVYRLHDPVMQRANYYGAHVSRAARIEPVTPEGCVYVTETFAAALALGHGEDFACDYVGWTEMAKHYGKLRMFLLKRRRHGEGPAVLVDFAKQDEAAARRVAAA